MIQRVALAALFLWVGSVAAAQGDTCGDDAPRLAVISAFAPENSLLLDEMRVEGSCTLNGRTFTYGTLEGSDVVLFLSGISMVNAAMTTQLGLDHFNVTHILVSGIAGGVDPELSIGDVVVPARWGQYQENVFARQAEDGWDPGGREGPFENLGMMFPQTVDVTRDGGEPDAVEEVFWFDVDPAMLEAAEAAARNVAFERCGAEQACLEEAPQVVAGGNGVSGPTFVDNAEYREYTFRTFDADALDMETAAVAHVAYANGVPYVAFRSLSDLAGGGPGANEIGTFFQVAANNSAALVLEFLRAWDAR